MNDSIPEVSRLKFSAPNIRYESLARFTNSKNECFLIRVSSDDPQLLEEYTQSLEVELELAPSDLISSPSPELEPPEISDNLKDDKIIESTEPQVIEKYLEVSIEGDRGTNLFLGQGMNFSFRRHLDLEAIPIDQGDIHITTKHFYGNSFNATVEVYQGDITVNLMTSTTSNYDSWIAIDKTFSVATVPNGIKVIKIKHSQKEKAFFALKIKAIRNASYDISGSIQALEPDDIVNQ